MLYRVMFVDVLPAFRALNISISRDLRVLPSDAELLEMIERADTDADGEISPDEFYSIMTKKTFT